MNRNTPLNRAMPIHAASKSAESKISAVRKKPSDALTLLTVFSNQGFRKTSMVALADTIGLTRQPLDSRSQTKELVVQWATSGLVAQFKVEAIGYLANTTRPTDKILWDAFCCYLCSIVKAAGRQTGIGNVSLPLLAPYLKTMYPLAFKCSF